VSTGSAASNRSWIRIQSATPFGPLGEIGSGRSRGLWLMEEKEDIVGSTRSAEVARPKKVTVSGAPRFSIPSYRFRGA